MPGATDFLDRPELRRLQWARLSALLAELLPRNRFYAAKYAAAGVDPTRFRGLEDVRQLPFTLKAELTADQLAHPPYGTNLTYPLTQYQRACTRRPAPRASRYAGSTPATAGSRC